MFNRRKSNDTQIEPVESGNDEEIYARGISSDTSNFESFPREFGIII